MKKKFLFLILCIIALCFQTTLSLVTAYEAWGWNEIRANRIDGRGDEFIKPIPEWGSNEFTGPNEMAAVLLAVEWVTNHIVWVADPSPPGDVWTASDQQYAKMMAAGGIGEGDCEDFSILLCAILRFHTQGGIPADRVWVQGGLIILADGWTESKPPIFGHAVVVYKALKGGLYYVEPQWGGVVYRGCKPSILNKYWEPPTHAYFAGESATLQFNDDWVRGGGFWLAGPRK